MAASDGSDEAALAASLTEPAGFAPIFERRVDGIFRYLSFRAGEAAEDLTAETFAQAFASRRNYKPDRGSVRAWLYGIATNLLRHHRRDEMRRMEALVQASNDQGPSLTDGATEVAERLRLGSALASLEPPWRNVVLLIGLGGLTYEEAAAVLDIPVGTVRSQYSRARARLIASLADPAGLEDTGGMS
jgi:RNA polymerase sigma factor (sigma-70 family)